MFNALKLWIVPSVTAILVASLALATDVQVLPGAASASPLTITWTPQPDLAVFSIELCHKDLNNAIAIANNVDPKKGKIDVPLPMVSSGGGYTVQFVNVTDISQTYATSGEFSIAPPVSTSESSSATASESAISTGSTTPTLSGSMTSASMFMSGMSDSAAASASASASHSAASTTASGAATRNLAQGASATAVGTGVVLLGLVSAAWIL